MPQRDFDSGYWTDPFVRKLCSNGKLLFGYLWTNDHCNQAGVYQLDVETIAFETKLPEVDLPDLLRSLYPKVQWYPDQDIIWVKNFLRRQAKSPKFLIAAAKCLKILNNNGVAKEVVAYNLERHSISIPYRYSTDTVSIPTGSASGSGSRSKKIGVVKGEEESPPSESEVEESLSAGDREVISVWCSVKAFSMPNEVAVELVARLRTEFPDVDILDESKAWAARKLSEPLKLSSRPSSQIWNWMRKAREFAQERRKGEQQSQQPKQERKRPITYTRGSEPVGAEGEENMP